MADITLSSVAETMRDIDFGMLSTRTEGGAHASRPMSNNRDVAYEGTSYFFSYESARTISDIGRDPQVVLTFTGSKGLFGKPPVFIAVQGQANLIRDKGAFEAHWTKDLERWFAEGVDTPGLVLIEVRATRIHVWDGEADTELVL